LVAAKGRAVEFPQIAFQRTVQFLETPSGTTKKLGRFCEAGAVALQGLDMRCRPGGGCCKPSNSPFARLDQERRGTRRCSGPYFAFQTPDMASSGGLGWPFSGQPL